jgi:adenylate cyclase
MSQAVNAGPRCRLAYETTIDESRVGETSVQPKDEPGVSDRATVPAKMTREIELASFPAILGRAKDCQFLIPLDELSTSRQHAKIEFNAGRFEIVDLQSRNGTFVNEKMVSRQVLRSGDKIKLGSFELLFTTNDATPAAPVVMPDEPVNVAASIDLRGLGSSMRDPSPATGPISSEQSIMGQSLRLPITWGISIFEKVTEALLTCPTLTEICERILVGASSALPCERSLLMLRNPTTGQLEIRARWAKHGGVESIRMSQQVVKRVLEQKQSLLIDDASADYFNSESLMAANVMSGMCAPLIREDVVHGLIYVDSPRRKAFRTEHLELLTGLALLIAVALQQDLLKREMEEQRKLKEWFERYGGAPPLEITAEVAAAGVNHMLAQSREVSVLFADISGFTSMSESRDPESIVHILNTVFEHFTQAVFDQAGMLDKFLGDGLMAVFGVPLYRTELAGEADHATKAILAALAMQSALDDYNVAQGSSAPLRLRVGINSGRVLLGDIGSVKRKDYTVIGDTVNVASRLESSVAQPGQVVVGPRTKQLAENQFLFQTLPPAKVKGKSELIQAYAVDRAAYLMKQSE